MICFSRSTSVSQLVWLLVALPCAPALHHLSSLWTPTRGLARLSSGGFAPSTPQQWRCLSRHYATCVQSLRLSTRGVASLATLCSAVLGQRANQWATGKSS